MGNKNFASMQKEASEFMKDPKKKMREWWDKWWEFMKDPKKKMREWWDKWWEFMKDSKKKMRECWGIFKFNHPWKACSLQYGVLALVILVGHILFGILSDMTNVDYFRYPLSETFRHPFNATANLTINRTPNMQGTEIYAAEMYADNARSILCTLVGSEAAIVAIVVSLTLIAIELTASAYSPRVIKISLKNPDMWFLLLIYGVAIFSSIILLKQLPYESRFPTEDVSLAFWFGLFSYVALVPYLWNIPQLLDPTNIVKRVSADIEKDKLLKYIEDIKKPSRTNGDTEGHEENPIQPILDIVYRSINNYDLETVRNGLDEIVKLAKKVIDAYNQDNASGKDNEKLRKKQMRFSMHFCDPLKRISGLAASKDDEGSTREVIKKLQTFGEKTADKQLKVATEQVAVTLGAVGKIATYKGKAFEDAVKEVAKSLGAVGEIATYKGKAFEDAVKEVAKSLGAVGEIAAGHGLEDAAKKVISSLKAVGEAAAKRKLNDAVRQVALALRDVGAILAEKELGNAVKEVVWSLEAVGVRAAEKGEEFAAAVNEVVWSLEAVGVRAVKKGKELEEVIIQAVKSLKEVGEAAVKKGEELPNTISNVAVSLKEVGEAAVEEGKELEEAVKEVVRSLEAVRAAVAEKEEELKYIINRVVSALTEVGEAAAKKGKELKDTVRKVVDALKSFGEDAVKKRFEEDVSLSAESLEKVGKTAAKKGEELEDTVNDVVSALEAVKAGTLNIDTVKKVISAIEAVKKALVEKKRLEDATSEQHHPLPHKQS